MRATVNILVENLLFSLSLLPAGYRYAYLSVGGGIVNVQKGSGTFPITIELSNEDGNKEASSVTHFK